MGKAWVAVAAWRKASNRRDSRWSCSSASAHGEDGVPCSHKRIHKNHSFSEVGPRVTENLLLSRIFRIRHPKKDYRWTNWSYLGDLNYPPVRRAQSLAGVVEDAERVILEDSLLECLVRYAMTDCHQEDRVWKHP